MSAERKILPGNEQTTADEPLEPFALKQQVAERLAAHRSRHARPSTAPEQPSVSPKERSSRIAAAVAERYAQSKTYRTFLAEEAERAIRQAEAVAEVARLNAEAVAEAQYDLLDRLDQYAAEPAAPTLVPTPAESSPLAISEVPPSPPAEMLLDLRPAHPAFTAASLTVKMSEELRRPGADMQRHHAREIVDSLTGAADPGEALFLDEEIAFRQSPVFEPNEPTVEIPANLIEFPRQLVAPKRARPRLAEGPLRDEDEGDHDPHQLRIFEVEAEQISTAPAIDSAAPEWTSILLDAQPRDAAATVHGAIYADYAAYDYSPNRPVEYATAGDRPAQHLEPTRETRHLYAAPLDVAPFQQRAMAALVDTCLVLAACMIFVAGAVLTISHFAPGGLHMTTAQAAIAGMGVFIVLSLVYQYIYFTLADSTPGMRYARIDLCSFANDNPSRSAMRTRMWALPLSIAPLGLGLVWSILDKDHLCWHDRISRMYQRPY